MPELFNTPAEIDLYRFPALFYPAAAILALALQAYLPLLAHWTAYLDLPLLVVVYFALNARHPAGSVLVGATVGLLQDSVSHLALGLNGIAESLAAYFAAALGGRLDAEHPGVRFLVIAVLYWLNAVIIFVIERFLMARPEIWSASRLLVAGLLNGVVAVMVFRLFDRFRQRR